MECFTRADLLLKQHENNDMRMFPPPWRLKQYSNLVFRKYGSAVPYHLIILAFAQVLHLHYAQALIPQWQLSLPVNLGSQLETPRSSSYPHASSSCPQAQPLSEDPRSNYLQVIQRTYSVAPQKATSLRIVSGASAALKVQLKVTEVSGVWRVPL